MRMAVYCIHFKMDTFVVCYVNDLSALNHSEEHGVAKREIGGKFPQSLKVQGQFSKVWGNS